MNTVMPSDDHEISCGEFVNMFLDAKIGTFVPLLHSETPLSFEQTATMYSCLSLFVVDF